MTLYLTRARISRTAEESGLKSLFLPSGEKAEQAPDPLRRALWTLFSDSPDRRRDFLWRVEASGQIYILSERLPEDKHALFQLESKPFEPALSSGDRLHFVLRVNATIDRAGDGPDRRVDVVMHALKALPQEERAAARMDIANREGRAWLARQGGRRGFELEEAAADNYRTLFIPRSSGARMKLGVIDLTGTLRVSDPAAFLGALAGGLGRARSFGNGLMLIRRAYD